MEAIKLDYPVDGVDSISMRRPKVRDMLAADKASGSDAEKEINMFSNLCEQTPGFIQDLD